MIKGCFGGFFMVKVKLKELMDSKGKTVYSISKETGISNNNLGKLVKGETNSIRFDVLDKLCISLDARIEDIIEHVPPEEKK